MFADIVNLHDMGVLQPCDGLRLSAEAFQVIRRGIMACQNHLQGDDAIELKLPGLVHNAHAAAAQDAQNLVAGDRRQRGRVAVDAVRRNGGAKLRIRVRASG